MSYSRRVVDRKNIFHFKAQKFYSKQTKSRKKQNYKKVFLEFFNLGTYLFKKTG